MMKPDNKLINIIFVVILIEFTTQIIISWFWYDFTNLVIILYLLLSHLQDAKDNITRQITYNYAALKLLNIITLITDEVYIDKYDFIFGIGKIVLFAIIAMLVFCKAKKEMIKEIRKKSHLIN